MLPLGLSRGRPLQNDRPEDRETNISFQRAAGHRPQPTSEADSRERVDQRNFATGEACAADPSLNGLRLWRA